MDVASLASLLGLDRVLATLSTAGGYTLLEHWPQGEFHHDLVLRVHDPSWHSAPFLVVAINCNGGVKEVLALSSPPDRWGLWHLRCPESTEFSGPPPAIVARAVTPHWFDPCELLAPDARSELRAGCRRRARGGGWEPV